MSVATARVVLKFNQILSRQWGWQILLLSVSLFHPPYFYLFRHLTLMLHILSALFYSYHGSKQHIFELTNNYFLDQPSLSFQVSVHFPTIFLPNTMSLLEEESILQESTFSRVGKPAYNTLKRSTSLNR